jgi:hypothetical protein
VVFVRDRDVKGEGGKSEGEEEEGVFHEKEGNDETRMRNDESMTKQEAPSFRHSGFIHHSPLIRCSHPFGAAVGCLSRVAWLWFRHWKRRFTRESS